MYNASKDDNSCKFVILNITTGLYNLDSFAIACNILTIPYFEHCYSELRTFGVINNDGNIKNALLHFHYEAVHYQAHSDTCKVERMLKKLCVSEGPFKGYPSLSQHKSKVTTISLTPIPEAAPNALASASLKLMPIDQFIETQSPCLTTSIPSQKMAFANSKGLMFDPGQPLLGDEIL